MPRVSTTNPMFMAAPDAEVEEVINPLSGLNAPGGKPMSKIKGARAERRARRASLDGSAEMSVPEGGIYENPLSAAGSAGSGAGGLVVGHGLQLMIAAVVVTAVVAGGTACSAPLANQTLCRSK